LPSEFQGVFLISCIAVLAPLLTRIPVLATVPVVAIELVAGMLVGPGVAGLVSSDAIVDFLAKFGLVFLFFQAGFELKPKDIGVEPLRMGASAWLISFALSALLVCGLYLAGIVRSPLLIAIALPTTAFGVLLPMLQNAGDLDGKLKQYALGAAAFGELGPLILASIALARDDRHIDQIFLSLLFVAIAIASIFVLAFVRSERSSSIILRWLGDREMLPVRASILLLLGFVYFADLLGIETVAGAYAAGLAVAVLVDGTKAQVLKEHLTTIGAGFFVPVFFVASGIELDLSSLLSNPLNIGRLLLFCLLFLLVRMAPLGLYRNVLDRRALPALGLLSATTLPLVVAIAYLGARRGQLSPENATALVGAAVVTVTAFPTLAFSICAAERDGRPPGPIESLVARFVEAIMRRMDAVLSAFRPR
jgi:Kef-type K+ transport system membrane component KefB